MENQCIPYVFIKNYLRDYYFKYNKKTSVLNAIKNFQENSSYDSINISFSRLWSHLSDDEFIDLINNLPMLLPETKYFLSIDEVPKELPETAIFPNTNDVFIFCQFHFSEEPLHTHNYFEIFYVFKGCCKLRFENELRTLTEGDLSIIAPNSIHSIIHDDESSYVFAISIRKSTFDNSFFSLLTQKDLLSNFFRTILYNETPSNYLLFSTGSSEDIKLIIKNLVMEFNKGDIYSNTGCISWVNLLFSSILRNYSESVQFYNYDFSTDFHLIMQYIKLNYRSLSLDSLARFFNYSEAHLSLLIKKHTGLSFIKLITSLKMSDAMDYLKNTGMSIEKISELIGYNSSDHFSRTFKKYYGCSPQKYRKKLNI